MTITFVPGEVNKSTYSLVQATWKNHHIIAYGSGNNLIILSRSTASGGQVSRHLQTIYLEADPLAIAINSKNAYIGISMANKITVFKPLNEYMTKPQWNHALLFSQQDDTSSINCLHWAPLENELVAGSDNSLALYHIYGQYGDVKYNRRWYTPQANPVASIHISANASRILTTSGNFDRFVKLWSRINYGDDNTLFEVSYLSHPKNSYVTQVSIRHKSSHGHKDQKVTDESMANIKNIRGYIDTSDDDNDIFYTLTNDNFLRVWATYEFSGHSHVRSWATLDLNRCFLESEQIATVLIFENYYLQKFFSYLRLIDSPLLQEYSSDLDLLLIVSKCGKGMIFTISNISNNPPNNIKFEALNHGQVYEFVNNSFPLLIFRHKVDINEKELTKLFLSSDEYRINIKQPIIVSPVCYLSNEENNYQLSILIHDRVKNTIRFNAFEPTSLLKLHKEKPQSLQVQLLSKLQGHTKSIRKLVKSNSAIPDSNILLSISNFPEHNYIWEPLILDDISNSSSCMSITKKFRIDVSNHGTPGTQGIWNAVILNDIDRSKDGGRHHLVVSLDKDGFISLWECQGIATDDLPADLVTRLEIKDTKGETVKQQPMAFILTESLKIQEYCIIAIFENDLIKAWSLTVSPSVKLHEIAIESLPQSEKIHQIASIDGLLSQEEKNLISTIDLKGHLKIYALDFSNYSERLQWKDTFHIHTNINNASKIHGGGIINKFAVVDESGFKLSIWDVKSGVLEYEEEFPESFGKVADLDWAFVNFSNQKLTANAILSVGFGRFVLLYTQLRYDYTNRIPTFAVLKKIDISDYTSHEIGDLIWLNNGYLVIGSGNQFFIDDKWIKLSAGDNNSIDSTIRQLMVGYTKQGIHKHEEEVDDGAGYKRIDKSMDDLVYDISHLVRILNGPLPIYHPQFLIQCLFMNQVKLVQAILVKLFQCLRNGDNITWDLEMDIGMEVMKCLTLEAPKMSGQNTPSINLDHDYLATDINKLDVFSKFGSNLSDLLVEKLMKISLPLLTRHQQITLISLITIVKDIKKYVLSLDSNGIRFLLGFMLFQKSNRQSKLSMRDINWALHSDNKEVLLGFVVEHYKNRLNWDHIKSTGLVYWVKTPRLSQLVESVARNEFSENRDPSGRVSLLYLALKKKQILVGLWRTVTHPEKEKMLKFLKNDFSEKRWKSAALKNAFVLLGKHRYLDAASFFLLGDAINDCCRTLANKVGDVQLALAVSKVFSANSQDVAQESESSLLMVIENYVLPTAVENGDRWTTSWIFWQLNLKELAIQALVRSPRDMIKHHGEAFTSQFQDSFKKLMSISSYGHSFLREDPVLILLFDDLRQRKVNYLKGSKNISPQEEFQFLIKVCMTYTRMGCDYLALLLTRNWNFIKPEVEHKTSNGEPKANGVAAANKDKKPDFSNKAPPPAAVFEEPDMSSFSFGF